MPAKNQDIFMFLNHCDVSYFRRKYNKIKRYLAGRNLEKKLEQQYIEIMRNKNDAQSKKNYN